jgi:hypothetical protein
MKWMDLEMFILSEASQAQKAKYSMFSLICRISIGARKCMSQGELPSTKGGRYHLNPSSKI